jgi:UDP-N-acetylglucosamine acyltransferase
MNEVRGRGEGGLAQASAPPGEMPVPVVHPTAVISSEVELSPGSEIGPFCLLDGRIRIGPGCRLIGHVTILGDSDLGAQNILHPNVVIGDEPQDVFYSGGRRRVVIGDGNTFREGVTVHRGSEQGAVTVIGCANFFMQNAHVAHDCRVGNSTIIAGGALLAGWVEVGDGAIVSGNCVVHQFVRLGRYSMMRGLSRTSRDVPPFCLMDGTHTVRAINTVGLRRAGFRAEAIRSLRNAFVTLFRGPQNLKIALEKLQEQGPLSSEVNELVEFIRCSKRGVAFAPRRARGVDDRT